MSMIHRCFFVTCSLVLLLHAPQKLSLAQHQSPPSPKQTLQEASIPKVAILSFDDATEKPKDGTIHTGKLVSEIMTTVAVKNLPVDVVERDKVLKLLDEKEFGNNQQSSGDTAQKLGSLLGADFVVTGAVAAFGGAFRIDARVVRISDGKVLSAEGGKSAPDQDALQTCCTKLITSVFQDVLPKLSDIGNDVPVWILASDISVDSSNKIWIKKSSLIRMQQAPGFCARVIKGRNGLELNIASCSARWNKVPSADKLLDIQVQHLAIN